MKKNYSNLKEALIAAEKLKDKFGRILYPYQYKNRWQLSSMNNEDYNKLMASKNKAIELTVDNMKDYCETFYRRRGKYPLNEDICDYFGISNDLLKAFLDDNKALFSTKPVKTVSFI